MASRAESSPRSRRAGSGVDDLQGTWHLQADEGGLDALERGPAAGLHGRAPWLARPWPMLS